MPMQVMEPPGLTNPMKAVGDLIVGGVNGIPTRVAAGPNGDVWTSNGPGVAPSWQPPAGAGITWPLTSATDMGFQPDGVANSSLNLQNAASAANGVNIKGNAAGTAPALTVSSSLGSEGLTINAKGSGVITLGNVSTGGVVVGSQLTVSTGGIAVTGNSTIAGTLGSLTGLTVVSGGIAVTGNSTIAGTLGSLTGLTVVSGTVALTAAVNVTGALTVVDAASTALTVAASGANYGLQVDESTASAVTGLKIKAGASGGGVALSAISSSGNEGLSLDAKGSGAVSVGGVSSGGVALGGGGGTVTTTGGLVVVGNVMTTLGDLIMGGAAGVPTRFAAGAATLVLTSNGVGAAPTWQAVPGLSWPLTNSGDEGFQPNSVANSTLNLHNAASAATGLNIAAAAAGSGLALSVLSSGGSENLTLDAKGAGTITIAGTSTGGITLGHAVTITTGGLVISAGGLGVTGTSTLQTSNVTSTAATAFTVAAAGANYGLQVDESTASAVTGLLIKAAAATGGLALSVLSTGGNEALSINAKGSGAIAIGSVSSGQVTVTPFFNMNGGALVNAAGAGAFVVGPGATHPTLNVDTSAASAATGLNIKAAAAGGGLALAVISSSGNEALTLDAKGSGTVTIGGTSSGAVILGGGGGVVTVVAAPVNATDVVNKAYVDGIAVGLNIKASVVCATTTALPTNTGTLGVITAVGNGALTVDGVAVATGNRVLVKNESVTPSNNGIYVVTQPGTGATPFILTRSSDMNSSAEVAGAFTFVESGTVNIGAGYVVTGVGPYTINVTAITWTQFSGAGELVQGTGITITGETIAVDFTVVAPLASPTFTGTVVLPTSNVTATGATAFTVAKAGTNYGLQVDESTASAVTGLLIKAAAATGGLALSVLSTGGNEALSINAKGSGAVSIGGVSSGGVALGGGGGTVTTTGGLVVVGNVMTTAGDLIIGGVSGAPTRLAATTNGWVLTLSGGSPVWAAPTGGGVTWPLTNTGDMGFQPDNVANNALNLQNAASAINGINILGNASGTGPAITVISSASNENLTIDAKGSGTITIAGVSNGAVTIDVAVNINGTLTQTGAANVISTASTAFTVTRSGANYGLQVDESAASAATGLLIKAAAATAGLALSVHSSVGNENLSLDALGSGTITIAGVSTGAITLGAAVTISGITTANAAVNITTSSATALSVAKSGANYALQVDTSTASAVTGLYVKAAASGGGLAMSVISSAGLESLKIDAKGGGAITIGGVSTGNINVGGGGGTIQLQTSVNAVVGLTVSANGAQITGASSVSGASANAFFVTPTGPNGTFNVDTSVASAVTGLNIQGRASGAKVAISVTSTATNEGLLIDAKNAGTINIGSVSTGAVLINGLAIGGIDVTSGDYVQDPASWNIAATHGSTGFAADAGHSHGAKLDPTNFGFVTTFNNIVAGGTATAWPVANTALFMRAFGSASVTNFNFVTGTSSGNIDIGEYASTGTGSSTAPTGAPIAHKGSTAMPAGGTTTMSVGTVETIVQGVHWLAVAVSNTTATFDRVSLTNAFFGSGSNNSMATALPLTTVASAATSNYGLIVFTS